MRLNNKQNQKYRKHLRSYPVILLLTAAVISVAATGLALRANYLGAIPLVEKVFKADQENGNTELALYNLRSYTYSHMNVNLQKITGAKPPIQLKNKYEQLVADEKKRVALTNEVILKQGESACGLRFPSNEQRIQKTSCVQDHLLQNGTKQIPIPDSLYKFDFVSPRWSPDLAGFCLLLSILSLAALAVRIVYGLMYKLKARDTT